MNRNRAIAKLFSLDVLPARVVPPLAALLVLLAVGAAHAVDVPVDGITAVPDVTCLVP
jgi:hypothetical protein